MHISDAERSQRTASISVSFPPAPAPETCSRSISSPAALAFILASPRAAAASRPFVTIARARTLWPRTRPDLSAQCLSGPALEAPLPGRRSRRAIAPAAAFGRRDCPLARPPAGEAITRDQGPAVDAGPIIAGRGGVAAHRKQPSPQKPQVANSPEAITSAPSWASE
jgi:hypothetical protein